MSSHHKKLILHNLTDNRRWYNVKTVNKDLTKEEVKANNVAKTAAKRKKRFEYIF